MAGKDTGPRSAFTFSHFFLQEPLLPVRSHSMGDNSGRFHTADADSGIRTQGFAITGAELSPGGSNIVIHWPTLPGRVYDVLWSTNAPGAATRCKYFWNTLFEVKNQNRK